jgi:structural maintenance of chromosome 1
MDAISFVLGIKSSHLRSAHLRDLVYRGRVLKTSKINDDGSAVAPGSNGNGDGEGSDEETQSQRPGRNDPKSAWVMAVYEDDAGDEQKWKRSITNQGASEYRINDRVVTAQQYNEALETENILIKARNFLVFQGDVEAIASQSPKDLTRLIEQISGSLEHKAEYERLQEESEQAAENQNYNLHRRRGINSEIKQYQEQKKEAEAFQAKADERDDAIVTHILWKLYHFQRVMEESTASIQEHQENLKEYRRGVEKYEKTLEEARQASAKVSKDVSKIERNIKKKERDIDAKELSLVPIDEKIDIVNQETEKIRKRVETVAKERNEQNLKHQKTRKDLATVDKAQKQFEKEWQEQLKKQGKQLSEADFREYNTLRSEVVSKTASNQSKLDNFTRQVKTDEVTVNSLRGRVEAIQASIERLQSETEAINERKEATRTSVKEITKEIDSKKKEFNKIQSDRIRVNQLRSEKDQKLQEVLKKLNEAESGRRQNDKEQRTKETIVALKRLYPGVRGRVGDLCKPKQKKFDEAVITALGRDFDAVIVDSEKTGSECVQYLKDQRFSPMTFIPLDNIKVTAPDASLKGLTKARLTIDTIDFDSAIERAMAYACGSSIVCDDLATAKHIVYQRNIQVKAVTLEGFVIHKAGLMTGGRGPENRGSKRTFEDTNVDELRRMANVYQEELLALPQVNRKGSAEEALESDLTALDQRLAYAKSELAAFEQNLASRKKELSHEQRQLTEMQPKYKERQLALEKSTELAKEYQDAVSSVQDKVYSAFCQRLGYADIRAYEAQQGSLEQEAAQKRNDFEVQKQRLEAQLKWETQSIQETDSRIERLESRISALERDIATYNAEKAELENAIDIDRALQTQMEDELHKMKEKLLAKNEKVSQAKNELGKRSKEIESRTKAISALETEAQRSSSGRYALLRRCKLEQITIPLTEKSRKLDSLPVDDNVLQTDPDAMDVDEEDEDEETPKDVMNNYGIEIDFEDLDEDLKAVSQDNLVMIILLMVFSQLKKTSKTSFCRESMT